MRFVGGDILAVDVKLLNSLIEERSIKQQVAEAIGIDRATLYRKMQGEGKKFSVDEAQRIAKAVPLTNEEAIPIFFAGEVAKVLFSIDNKKREEVK